MAIICGELRRGPNKGKWISCLDFDSKDAFDKFCEILGTSLEDLAKWTLVEWHGSLDRIHVFIITNTPLKNVPGLGGLEIKAGNPGRLLAFVSPSLHKGDNEPYRAYDKFNTSIAIIDNIEKIRFESIIDTFLKSVTKYEASYFAEDDNNKNQYIEYINLEDTILRAGERHYATLANGASMFFKRLGEWENLSDSERFDRLVVWHKKHCVPSLFEEHGREKEVEKIWKDICRNSTGRRQQQRDKREYESRQIEEQYKDTLDGLSEDKQNAFKSYNTEIKNALSGNVWVELEKDEWIVANKQENVIYRSKAITREVGNNFIKIFTKGPKLLKCIPIEITRYENPLDFLDQRLTYTITFKDTTSQSHTLVRKTLDEIADWLKNYGYILPTGRRGGTVVEVLSAMIDAFREDCKLNVDKTISSMGIYHVNDKLTSVGCEEYIERYKKQTINQRKDAIKFIEGLIGKFRTGIIPTALKVGVMSPFNFALKQYTDDIVYSRSLWAFGVPRTGKSTVTNIPVWLYYDKEKDRKAPFTSINTEARLGKFVSKDTFPALVYELKALNKKDDPRAIIIIEMLKAVIETQEARGTMNRTSTVKTSTPSLRQINFSSNPRPPNDPALSSRIIKQNFTDSDRHTDLEKDDFHRFMNDKYHLRTLGDFVIGYVFDNPTIIFNEDKSEINWERTAKELITKFYELSMIPRPNWLDLPLTNQEDEDYEIDETNNNIDSFRTVLKNYFNEYYNKYIRRTGDEAIIMPPIEDRIKFCVDNELTPCFTIGAKGRLIIFHGIINELEKRGIGSDRIGSLKEVAELLDMEHGQLKVSGKNIKCVYGDMQKLYDFVTVTEDDIQETFPISN